MQTNQPKLSMDEPESLELVITPHNIYVGKLVDDDATAGDENYNDVPCIILEPRSDHGVEVWIPKKLIMSRTTITHA